MRDHLLCNAGEKIYLNSRRADSRRPLHASFEIRRLVKSLVNVCRWSRHTVVLAAYLTLVVFRSCMVAQGTAAQLTASTIHFRSPRGFSIVVPVYVNGNGPFRFLLDIGSTITVVDPELLRSLGLHVIGSSPMTTLAGRTTIPLAVARTVSVGPLTESNVELVAQNLAGLRKLDSRIRGVLGENALKNADFLIDYRKRTIEIDSSGTLLTALGGERVNTNWIAMPDNPNQGSIAVPVKLAESNPRNLNLILDSGSASVVLFADSIDPAWLSGPQSLMVETAAGNRKSVPVRLVHLRVASISLNVKSQVTVSEFKGLAVNGLLPTASFGSVYISNKGGFVIFQPKRSRRRVG